MRVLKDSFIYLAGELFAKILPFLMLPYLTRKLGPAGFGELSYYLTMLALFSIFIGLSQEGAITRYFYFYGKKALNTVVKAGYLYNIVISFILLLICLLYKAEIMAYIVLATMFQSLVSVQLALRQCQKQPFKYITIQIILSITNVLFTVVFLEIFSQNLVAYRILAIVIANAVTFFIASIILGNLFKEKNKITYRRLKLGLLYIFSFGIPLILHQSSFFVKGQLDRIFIYQQYSKTELGIYSAGVQIASILPIILMALNKALLPYYYEFLKKEIINIGIIKKYFCYSLLFVPVPALIAWSIPNQLYLWILGSEFEHSKYFTVIFTLGFTLNLPYLLLVNYFFYYGKNSLISICSIMSAIVYIGALFVSSSISLQYVPFSLIISNIFLLILLWTITKKTA